MVAMHARLLALSLAPLFAASIAHAQAPGEWVPPPVAAPDGTAVCAGPCGCRHVESVMANRWSIGLSLGSMSLAPDGQSDNKTAFGVGELALRFRMTRHLELELSAGGGREQLDDDRQGDLEVTTVALAARYRFNPEGAWNFFAMAGIGAAAVTFHDATQDERDRATHPMATLGVGLERRFHHFALQAELRAIGIGDRSRNDPPMDAPPPASDPTPMAVTVTPPTTTAAHQKLGGGVATIGLSYYF